MHPKKYEDSNTNHVMLKTLDDYSWVFKNKRKDAITISRFIILRNVRNSRFQNRIQELKTTV